MQSIIDHRIKICVSKIIVLFNETRNNISKKTFVLGTLYFCYIAYFELLGQSRLAGDLIGSQLNRLLVHPGGNVGRYVTVDALKMALTCV